MMMMLITNNWKLCLCLILIVDIKSVTIALKPTSNHFIEPKSITKNLKMTSITYSSTRGGQKNLDFRTVVMTGLAHDRGLFVPDNFPTVGAEELESWRGLDFPGVAVKVISKFVKDDQVPAEKLEDIVRRSCAAFRHDEVTPVIDVGGHKVLVSFEN